jgi:hypothetical protein
VTFGTGVLRDGFLFVCAGFVVRGRDVVAVGLGGSEGAHGLFFLVAKEEGV